MISITDHAEGCVLAVRAQAGARKDALLGEYASALKVAVTAPAESGRANEALIRVLSDALNLKRSQVDLLSGQSSRQKRFLLRGVRKPELESRLRRLLQK